MAETYSLLYHGIRAICPVCAGMMTGPSLRKYCIDCHRTFVCTGEGITESELLYEEEKAE